jgi:hypothetical protein
MLNTILIVAGVVIVLFIIVVQLQPATFRITRMAMMSAKPEEVFPQVNDFYNWSEWSPWANLDPGMKQTYEGAGNGTGAIYSWTGNKQVGEGRMTIIESRPNDLVKIKLEFLKPFKATNIAEFTFKRENGNTLVTWSMLGDKNFMFKAVHMFMNMDKMIGRDFEKGLSQMKQVVERKQVSA